MYSNVFVSPALIVPNDTALEVLLIILPILGVLYTPSPFHFTAPLNMSALGFKIIPVSSVAVIVI